MAEEYGLADYGRSLASGATYAWNDEIEARLRTLADSDPEAYRRVVNEIRARQDQFSEDNLEADAGLMVLGSLLPAVLTRKPSMAVERKLERAFPRVVRPLPRPLSALSPMEVGMAGLDALLYGSGEADTIEDIPESIANEFLVGLGIYGGGKALANKAKPVVSRLRNLFTVRR